MCSRRPGLLFGGDSASAAAPVTGAQIDLLKGENWKALFSSVNVLSVSETVNFRPAIRCRIPLQGCPCILWVRISPRRRFLFSAFSRLWFSRREPLLGFSVTQNGVTLATGSGYALTAATLLKYINLSISDGNATPLFDMWFSIPTTVSGTAAVIAASLATLEPYVDITAVDITGSTPLSVDVADFKTYETLLNKVSGGFEVSDTALNVKAALIATGSALIADAKDIKALVLSNGAASPLQLTAAQATAAASVLAKLSGDAIVEVRATDGSWTTTGHGNGLTLHDITGLGRYDHRRRLQRDLRLRRASGQRRIADFSTHYKGTGHDIVELSKLEFAKGDATLLADATLNATHTGIVVTAGTNSLRFTGFTTMAEFTAAVNGGDFKFV